MYHILNTRHIFRLIFCLIKQHNTIVVTNLGYKISINKICLLEEWLKYTFHTTNVALQFHPLFCVGKWSPTLRNLSRYMKLKRPKSSFKFHLISLSPTKISRLCPINFISSKKLGLNMKISKQTQHQTGPSLKLNGKASPLRKSPPFTFPNIQNGHFSFRWIFNFLHKRVEYLFKRDQVWFMLLNKRQKSLLQKCFRS